MKKLLLSFFCCLMALASAQAQKVTFDFTNNDWGFPTSKSVEKGTFTHDGYSITLTVVDPENDGYYFTKGYLMLGKKGATLELPAFDFDVAKIEVVGESGGSKSVTQNIYVGETAVSDKATGAKESCIFKIVEEYQTKGTIYTFKVENSNNTRITAIKIFEVSNLETLATPEITPESCSFNDGESLEVRISAAEGATIHYTLDGTAPTKDSEVYSGPIVIEETTTVRAIAIKEGFENSEIAKTTYTKQYIFKGSVTEALEAYVNYGLSESNDKKVLATVTGYIVGVAIDKYEIKNEEDVLFGNETEVASNILIADNAEETNYTKCLLVQLPSGKVREALNLVDNKDKYKAEVVLTGTLEKYFNVAGLKNTKIAENSDEEDGNGDNGGNGGNEGNEGGDEVEAPTPTTTDQLIEGKNQEITGWVIATNTVSFIVEDEEGCVLVYLGTTPQCMEGQVVKVQGVVEEKFDMLQFPKTSTITPTGETKEIERPEPVVMDAAAMDAYLASPYIEYVEYTGTLTVSGAYYNVEINGANTAIGSITYPSLEMMNNIAGTVKVTGYTTGVSQGKYINTMAVKVANVTDGTGINNVEMENSNAVIFDITGRKVNNITVPGIYIVNGKKVLVK